MRAQIGQFLLVAAIALSFPVAPALAAVVNLDFEQPGDATHVGTDGILSSAGTTWNSVLFDTDASGLADEAGNATAFELVYLRNGTPNGPFVNLGVFNSLQDTGVLCEGFEIRNLVPDTQYTLAVYGGFDASFSVEHAGGFSGGPCTGFGPGFSLPGTEGQDYCQLTGLVPMELSPGVHGLRILNVSGPILGLQLEGSTDVVEPPVTDETAPLCWLSSESEGPPRSIRISAQDSGSGLNRVSVLMSENAEVEVPAFGAGTNDEVVIEATQIDGTLNTLVRLELVDREGNSVVHDFGIQGTPEDPEEPVRTPCEDLIAFFDEAVAAGTLQGNGPGRSANGRRGAFRHMLEDVCELLDAGLLDEACSKLNVVHRKCDGDDGDFVAGEATEELRSRILEIGVEFCDGDESEEIPSGRGSTYAQSNGTFSFKISWGIMKALYDTN